MYYYFAPMEGITGYHFRNIHHELFPGAHKYFTPFRVACQDIGFRKKELEDLLPEHNAGVPVVPQILSNDAEAFLIAVRQLQDLGYKEINLNLGCPSGTVISKYRGSGFLGLPAELDAFLDRVFSETTARISIKTRIGLETSDSFEELMDIYEKYPMSELIIHPRYGRDGYRGTPHMEAYRMAYDRWELPLCYNGDITALLDLDRLLEIYPETDSVMVGRGCVTNPALIRTFENGTPLTLVEFQEYERRLFSCYSSILSGDRHILFRMKELWAYFICLFPDSRKQMKALRKSQTCSEYEDAVKMLYRECPFDPSAGFSP